MNISDCDVNAKWRSYIHWKKGGYQAVCAPGAHPPRRYWRERIVIAERGSAITIGSMALQGYARTPTVPRRAFERPNTAAYFVLTKKAQMNQTSAPMTRLAFAARGSGLLQYTATAKMGRNADAQRPMNIAVAIAMILPGIRNAMITLITIIARTPAWFARRERAHSLPLPQTSQIRAVPIAWNCDDRVDI